jgi:hypothetical protein
VSTRLSMLCGYFSDVVSVRVERSGERGQALLLDSAPPAQWQTPLPASVKRWPASGINRQS